MHPEIINFVAKSDFTRRGFVVTSLATGFALAVQPVCAQTTITTDTNGLDAGEQLMSRFQLLLKPQDRHSPRPDDLAHPPRVGRRPLRLR